MEKRSPGISLNGAPSQYDRWLRIAGSDSVKVDARPFAELLAFAPQFAQLIRFYNINNHVDGDWTAFFLTDPTLILASILSLDLHTLERRFRISLKQAREAKDLARQREHVLACFEAIIDFARQIDGWLAGAQMNRRSQVARLFAGETASWIAASLSGHLRHLKALAHWVSSPEELDIWIEIDFQLSRAWQLALVEEVSPFHGKKSRREKFEHLVSILEEIYQAFDQVLRNLKEFAAKHLPRTLRESHHKPQIALYIAFVRLFQTEQRTLNTLTRRFARFYYRDVLRENNAGPVPDSVYLTFVLDPATGVDAVTVAAGTQFPAGKEADGSNILYAANASLSVSAAALESVRALRVVYGPLYSIEPSSPGWPDSPDFSSLPSIEAPQQVLGTEIDVELMNDEAAGKGSTSGPIPWATFGNPVSGTSDIAATTPVTLGFAVASPYLMLTGGTREVNLTFHLQSGAARLGEYLESLAAASALDEGTVFEQIIGGAFDLYLSTVGGWFPPDSYSCICGPVSNAAPRAPEWFSLTFTLPASAPQVVAYSPSTEIASSSDPPVPDDLNPAPGLPTLKAYLRPTPVTLDSAYGQVITYPLSLLAEISIEQIEIASDTRNLANLQIENSTGQIDSSVPFPVFGGTPVTGSYLDLTNPELFVKKPDPGTFQVRLGWFGLPANTDGFLGYYQGYVVGVDGRISPTPLFDNQTFGGSIQVRNPGEWALLDGDSVATSSPPEESGVFLFRTQDDCFNPVPTPDGSLCTATTFDTLEVIDTVPPPYYDPAASAIRLTLTEPSYAFGNILYAPNVLNAAISELPKTGTEPSSPTACQPLQVAANSLAAIVPAGAQSPDKSQVQSAVQQAQEHLIQAAQSYLAGALAKYGASVAAWVEQEFTVAGSKTPPYRAQTIRMRLQSDLPPLDSAGLPGSPPYVPKGVVRAIRNARRILQAVIRMQQCLDHCAAETGSSYETCIRAQLNACQQMLRDSYATCVQEAQTVTYPNPPWTPQAESLSVDYSAHCAFSPSAAGQSCGSYFYLLPFGGYKSANAMAEAIPLLPVVEPGSLELGFSGFETSQTLNLLVQMCAADIAVPSTVTWQYFESNSWKTFQAAQIPADTTNGLENTGVIVFSIPAATASAQTAAPAEYRWIRAVTTTPQLFPDSAGIYPHCLLASWVGDGGGSGEHLKQPLPPYTINSSVQNLPAIQTINQPIESFGGRPPEDDKAFQARLAERLRHKDRAILVWDYEQLVLERFPTIWKAQALPVTSGSGVKMPGRVLVMVVAGPNGTQVADSTEPLATSVMLEEIRSYLAALASPFAVIQVVNPAYVRIRVDAEVIFRDVTGGGDGIDRLNSELVEYLSPWFYDAARAASGGSYASENAITRFIQTRPYVGALIEVHFDYDPLPETLDWYFLTSAKSHSIREAGASTTYIGEQACFH